MLIREYQEELERKELSPYAALSCQSRGRKIPEEECSIRTAFQRDRDRIVHCKSFRQLKHKTQVFLIPEVEHLHTRLIHAIQVSQIARTIAKALRLNEDLTEAIALGHDLGHPPFGHTGEVALNEICPNGFRHSEQSLRVVEVLEKNGEGLNLTLEVRDGILKHSRGATSLRAVDSKEQKSITLEGAIVRWADSIAYINHDIDDALSAQIVKLEDLPSKALDVLGVRHSTRINTMVRDIIENSYNKPFIGMSELVLMATDEIRTYLYEHVYPHKRIRYEAQKAERVLKELFWYYLDHLEEIEPKVVPPHESKERIVIDYLSALSDREALSRYEEIFLPKPWAEE
ncbi:TPA: deoxyguanosinetriphosphate triphosphohydrolase [bacterium]|nr:deoxyguanosinetriphosphate triphosphohydrolase [bacterium]